MKKPTRSGARATPAHLLDTSTLLWALASQAVAEGLALVTNDEPIAAYPVRTIW